MVAAIGGLVDITDLMMAELALARSEASYKELAENSSDLVLRLSTDGRVLYASPSALAMTGYAPDTLIGRSWFDFMRPDDAPRIRDAIQGQIAAGAAGPPGQLTYGFIHADGHELQLESRPAPTFDAKTGAVTGFTTMIRDVSEQRAAEAELRRARIEAERAAAAKSEFLANMSHELRTPLTAVLGFSQLVGEQPELSDTTRSYLERVTNGGSALLMTVNDILDFSKLEAGQVHIKPRATSPTKLAGDALNLFSLLASEKGLTLSAHDTDALPAFVSLDPDRVRQVLLNLLGNAVKFTTVGGVRLETTYDTSRGRITFAVVDSGAGIDADGIKQLFQRFSQVDGSTTRKYGGTGLGLAICKGLVEAMGGEIGVKSARGEGSRFWFSIPAEKVQSKAVIEAEHAARDIPGGCRVLVVDDHMANRALVRSLLAPYEVEITEAWDGLEAIDAAMSAPYDVILMDLRMPNMNGETAARRIRGVDGPNDATPIIALSADVMSGKANGLFADSVAKPISPATLILAISNATNSQSDCLAHAAL